MRMGSLENHIFGMMILHYYLFDILFSCVIETSCVVAQSIDYVFSYQSIFLFSVSSYLSASLRGEAQIHGV